MTPEEANTKAKASDEYLVFWQARFNLLYDAWRTGTNECVLEAARLMVSANDVAPARFKIPIIVEMRDRIQELTHALRSLVEYVQNTPEFATWNSITTPDQFVIAAGAISGIKTGCTCGTELTAAVGCGWCQEQARRHERDSKSR